MKLLTALVLFAAVASAQGTPANPLTTVSKNIYAMAKKDILGSVDKVPDEMWSFQPTKEVRTFAQLFAHVADGQYEFCGVAAEGKSVSKDIEKTSKTKAEIVPALKDAFAYCDAAYAKLTDATRRRHGQFLRHENHQARRHGFQHRPHHGALRQPGHLHAN